VAVRVSRPSDAPAARAATLLIGVVAGLHPAIRAARLHPTVALNAT
ncbi:ABC transporter permease, partial [Streptomyces parvus]|nr:ABC transporter permease [Streptomyces parvus]